jgi:hypothetical protein
MHQEKKKEEKKSGHALVYGDEKKDEKGKYERQTSCVQSDKPSLNDSEEACSQTIVGLFPCLLVDHSSDPMLP